MRRPGAPRRRVSGRKAGRERGYCQLEKLHQLEQLPDDGFTVICLPVKIKGGSAGWTRAVAVIDGDAQIRGVSGSTA